MHDVRSRLRERNVFINRICNFKSAEGKNVKAELIVDCSLDLGNGCFWFNNWNIRILSEPIGMLTSFSLIGVTIDTKIRYDYISRSQKFF